MAKFPSAEELAAAIEELAADVVGIVKEAEPFVPFVRDDQEHDFLEFVGSPDPFRTVWTGKGFTLYVSEITGRVIGGILHNVGKYATGLVESGNGQEEGSSGADGSRRQRDQLYPDAGS